MSGWAYRRARFRNRNYSPMTRIVQESHSRSYHPGWPFVTVASTRWPICSFDWSYDLQVLPLAIRPQPVTIDFVLSRVMEQVPSAWHSLMMLVTRPLITCGADVPLLTPLLFTYNQAPIARVATAIAATMNLLCFMPQPYHFSTSEDLNLGNR